MSRITTDARQIALRRFLEQIGNRTHHDGTSDAKPAGQSELDNLLDSIDLDLTPPLRMDASNPADLTVSVGAAIVTNTESGRNKTIPHIGSLLPNDFASGTLTFPSSSGGTITVTPGNNGALTVPSNEYVKVLVYMDANGDLNVLQGVTDAVEANATVLPAPASTLPLGYVTLFNNAGTIDNIQQSKIYQFGTGAGGGGGTGNANEFVETLKNRLNDSIFEAVTPYIAETDQDDSNLVDGSSTGEFDLVNSRFKLTNIGDTLVSAQMLDSTFLGGEKGVSAVEVMLKFDSDGLDTGATFEVSRNAGNEWQDITSKMERIDDSFTYRGFHEFDEEASNQTIDEYSVSNADDTEVLTGTVEKVGQIFTVSNIAVIRDIELYLSKTGTPDGNYFVSIVKDDSGSPSTDPTDIVYETSFQPVSGLAAGNNTVNFAAELVLGAGDYHVVVSTDGTYQGSYSAGVDEIAVRTDSSAPSIPDLKTFSSSTWSAVAGESMTYKLDGIELDLRLRVTSSVTDALIEGFGVFYEQNLGNLAIATTVEGITKVSFKAVADNTNSFTLPFTPNADLLVVHLLGSGQSFRFGDFSLQGNTVVFPENQFNNGGIEKTQTVIFDQIRGGAFDNSDVNATLLANNHLGSTDGAFDKSQAGRGIFLRRPDGTLREITIDDNDNIAIYSV